MKINYLETIKNYRYLPLGTLIQHPKFGRGKVINSPQPAMRSVMFTWEETVHAYDLSPAAIQELAFENGVDNPVDLVSVTTQQSETLDFEIDELSQWVVC
jgi:hypothetical protein